MDQALVREGFRRVVPSLCLTISIPVGSCPDDEVMPVNQLRERYRLRTTCTFLQSGHALPLLRTTSWLQRDSRTGLTLSRRRATLHPV